VVMVLELLLLLVVVVGRSGGKHLGLPLLRGGHCHWCRCLDGVVERCRRVSRVVLLPALNLHVVLLLLLLLLLLWQSETLAHMSVGKHHQRAGLWSANWE
jgi:hypothetical protein